VPRRGSEPATASPAAGEFDRIARFFRPLAAGFPGAFELKDDAALVEVPPGMRLVVTTDAMVAGVHFLPTDPPGQIAAKLLRVNLSDLAAKGASPLAYSLVTGLPGDTGDAWLADFAAGLAADQATYGIHLLGGDSVSTSGPMTLTVSALGLVPGVGPNGGMVRRSGAQAGDLVFVSGTVGDAALGLRLALGKHLDATAEEGAFLLSRLRLPQPRTALAPVLRDHATAAADVSDGLLADLGHLCTASGHKASVRADRLPLSPAASRLLEADPALLPEIVAGGDDYEIIFTVPPGRRDALLAAAAQAGVPIAEIGMMSAGAPAVTLLDAGGRDVTPPRLGWQHF